MALIRTLSPRLIDRSSVHDPIEATYSAFTVDGDRYIQIDSYGRPNRKYPGKTSQSTQLDKQAAMTLFEVIKREFQLQ